MEQGALPRRAGVVVVGGGIAGAASAFELARRGLDVVLLEKGEVAGEQSGRNWGWVRQQGRDPAELPLMMAANRLWRGLERELEADVEWVEGGNLKLARREEDAARLEEWVALAAEAGLETRLVGMDEVRRLLPGIRGDWAAGMHTPSDGHADPVKATSALAAAAERHGARLVTGCTVRALLAHGRRIAGVATDRGEIAADHVVCAAGVWSRRLLATVGLDLPQQRSWETVLRTEPAPPLTRLAVLELGGVAFRQTPAGNLVLAPGAVVDVDVTLDLFRHLRLFGPAYLRNRRSIRLHVGAATARDLLERLPGRREPFRTPEPPPRRADVERCLSALAAWFPELAALRVERAWTGVIDGTPDLLPVLWRAPDPDGLVVATGFSGHGFGLGPIVGVVVADLVAGRDSEFDLRPLRLTRFAEGDFRPPRNV